MAPVAAKDFFGIRAGEGVARDVLAALDAFEQEGIFCVVREAQMRADGGEQVGGEGFVHRDEIALARERREGSEIGLNHCAAIFSSFERARKTARRMAASGARSPVQISHCAGALRDEHVDSGNGFDAAARGELQEPRRARAIDQVNDQAAIQFGSA